MDVLIVDDEPLVREIVAEGLLDDGLAVTTAISAEDALAAAMADGEPSVVVTDVNLGAGMNGLMLAAEIHRRWPGVGVVIMTGDARSVQNHPLTARELLLRKPFDSPPLISAVRELMGRSAR